jgi:hypothetical protein
MFVRLTFRPWRWRQYVSQKRQKTSTGLQGVTFALKLGSLKLNYWLVIVTEINIHVPCAWQVKHCATETYAGVDVETRVFFTSALIGSQWSGSRPGCFTPEERAPVIHWFGRSVDPHNWLRQRGEKENLTSTGARTQTSYNSPHLKFKH